MSNAFQTWWNFCQRPENDGQPIHNTPGDAGGWTAYGITLRTYQDTNPGDTKDDLAKMTQEEAGQIALADYWNACKCDRILPQMGIVLCDAAWLSGPRKAVEWLQETLGLKIDGAFGPMTLSACDAILPISLLNYCKMFTNTRIAANNNPEFNNGWKRRANACLQIAVNFKG